MENLLTKAIYSVRQAELSFCKFITANDAGATGAHQSGFHIHKNSWPLIFDKEGIKGENKDKFVTIRWQDEFETNSRFIYYGIGTRNEYRLTRFGKGFPFLADEYIGALLIICKKSEEFYEAYVLQKDSEIEEFFSELNISSTNTNSIIQKFDALKEENRLFLCFEKYLRNILDFPPSHELANVARKCYNNTFNVNNDVIRLKPDKEFLNWIDSEFKLFKIIENKIYSSKIKNTFSSVDELIQFANTVLNRRKSRAGKSLEHHLSELFKIFEISYCNQSVTEDNKKPDFIFPDSDSYHNLSFNPDKLVMLAAKTTCKDRWRQILNEADRIKKKHLFTLQQGISKNQLHEMYKYNVCLVVPKPYLSCFPKEFRDKILTLSNFLRFVKSKQV